MWAIYLNGQWLGMVVTNWAWEAPYWRSRCTDTKRYVMQETPPGRVPAQSLIHERTRHG